MEMWGTAVIVFREVLEAALIVTIVMAATQGVPNRERWVIGGVVIGILGACLVAAGADRIAQAAAGFGQELFNATVLFVAIAMLAWHNVWMHRHGAELARHFKRLGGEVRVGTVPLYMLTTAVSLAVLREGAEVVLLTQGMMSAGAGNIAEQVAAVFIGIATGTLVGIVLYFGLSRIPLRHIFGVTGMLMLLLAAGMAARAAGYLEQADILPALGHRIWDTSNILAEQSWLGQILHTLVGYQASPDGIQVVFYSATIIVIAVMMSLVKRRTQGARTK